MKIVNDCKNGMYVIVIEYPETELHVATNNIFEARERFIEFITSTFDNTVAEKFKEEL